VSDYRPDNRVTGVRFTAETKDFSSSLCVETGSGAHLAYPMGTAGKARTERDPDYSSHLVSRPEFWLEYGTGSGKVPPN